MLDMGLKKYAEFELRNGARILSHDSVYWRMVAPFFWRPLFQFQPVLLRESFPLHFYLGGFQYPTPESECSNSLLQYYAFLEPDKYELDSLDRKARQAVTHAKKHIEIKDILNACEFIEESFPVYLSFYERTNYFYKKNRICHDIYRKWCKNLLNSGKISIIGAYFQNSMIGFMALARIEDIVIIISTFSHSDYLKYGPSDLMYHEARERVSKIPGIRMIYIGGIVNSDGINRFKEKRGATLVSVPSTYFMNPVMHLPVKYLFPEKYRKMIGR